MSSFKYEKKDTIIPLVFNLSDISTLKLYPFIGHVSENRIKLNAILVVVLIVIGFPF